MAARLVLTLAGACVCVYVCVSPSLFPPRIFFFFLEGGPRPRGRMGAPGAGARACLSGCRAVSSWRRPPEPPRTQAFPGTVNPESMLFASVLCWGDPKAAEVTSCCRDASFFFLPGSFLSPFLTFLRAALPELSRRAGRGGPRATGGRGGVQADGVPLARETYSRSCNLEEKKSRGLHSGAPGRSFWGRCGQAMCSSRSPPTDLTLGCPWWGRGDQSRGEATSHTDRSCFSDGWLWLMGGEDERAS